MKYKHELPSAECDSEVSGYYDREDRLTWFDAESCEPEPVDGFSVRPLASLLTDDLDTECEVTCEDALLASPNGEGLTVEPSYATLEWSDLPTGEPEEPEAERRPARIREWDGTIVDVTVLTVGGYALVRYSDGVTHVVTVEYLYSIEVR